MTPDTLYYVVYALVILAVVIGAYIYAAKVRGRTPQEAAGDVADFMEHHWEDAAEAAEAVADALTDGKDEGGT